MYKGTVFEACLRNKPPITSVMEMMPGEILYTNAIDPLNWTLYQCTI